MKFIDPRIDFAFKKIFGSEEAKDILISFLESLLGLEGDRRIADLTILDPFMAPKIQAMKSSILDVRCQDHRGVSYIVEMQVQKTSGFLRRIQFNASKAYSGQVPTGGKYPDLQQVIAITITDFILFPTLTACVSYHTTRDEESGQHLLDGILYYFIELTKFTKPLEELQNHLDQWIFFIKEASTLTEIPPNLREPALIHAFECAREAAMDREERELYDKACMATTDARGAVQLAREEGEQVGERRGRQEGEQIGEQRGLQKGESALLQRLLQRRFGNLPEWAVEKLRQANREQIEKWSDRVLEAQALEEVFE